MMGLWKRQLLACTSALLLFLASCKKEVNQATVTPTPTDTTVVVPPTNPPNNPPVYNDNDHMFFGNPSNAILTTDSSNNYLLRKDYYALAYNNSRGCANWVSWHLYAPDLGSIDRQDDFRPDYTIPISFYSVPETAYSGSGFDRGHNCPSGDRTSTYEANSATFLMTNMIPQAPNNNQLTWADLETYTRTLVNNGNEAYVIMGAYGKGGTGSSGYKEKINSDRVTVPSNIWKVIVVLPNGNADSSRVTAATRVIAVNTPNDNNSFTNSTNKPWRNYRTSVDAIEAATGYNLLSRLPEDLQTILEAKIDNQ